MATVDEPNASDLRSEGGARRGTPVRLLVVEDSSRDFELAVLELRRGGIEPTVHRVETKDQFVNGLDTFEPEVILLDYQLPQFGPKLAIIIARERLPGIPLIVVSGIIGEERAVELLKLGASDFVSKDRLDYLPAAVRRALDDKAEHQERLKAERQARNLAEELRACVAERALELEKRDRLIEEQVSRARGLQMAMLPRQCPPVSAGAASGEYPVHFTSRYRASKTVAGDFFEWVRLGESAVGLLSCDVACRDARPVLLTAFLRAVTASVDLAIHEPGRFLLELDREVADIARQIEATLTAGALFLVADFGAGELRFANAGHPLPIRVRRDRREVVLMGNREASGPPLGTRMESGYATQSIPIKEGDPLLVFTGGLIEVENSTSREPYGMERLMTALHSIANRSTDELLDTLLDDVTRFGDGKASESDLLVVGIDLAVTR